VRGVRVTRRSASPQFRVRVPARAPRSCGVNSQHSGLLIRRVRVQLPPAPPYLTAVIEGGRSEKSSGAERPESRESRRARAAKGPVCKAGVTAGATPAVVSILFPGAVMIIAACRTCNADETERNRPAPPICPGGVDRRTTAFQADGAGAIPAPGTTGLRCPSGRVGFQVRPGGCDSLRACQFMEVRPI
jgi:hypothetical protein